MQERIHVTVLNHVDYVPCNTYLTTL